VRDAAPDEDAGTDSMSSACGDGRVDASEQCDTAIAPGRPGACPSRCEASQDRCVSSTTLDGEACQRRCVLTKVTRVRDGDGCCPPGADAMRDRDCGQCGDGVIASGETCDPPERCPNEQTCRSEGCYIATLSGDPNTCTSTCSRTSIVECGDGDACCPAGCSRGNDNDCALACGDGLLDETSGESCEPLSTIAPCVTSCDDGEACTLDVLTGSSQNCNARCAHFPVTAAIGGDRCCPPGANAANDSDCGPRCGNNVQENGEECDGGEACSAECKTVPMEQRQCLAEVMLERNASQTCKECVCTRCAQLAVDCYGSGDATRDDHCADIVRCARSSGCSRDACYCGTSLGCFAPNGACREQIEDGAGSQSPQTVEDRKNDRGFALVRAREYAECERERCADACERDRDRDRDRR
jgi:hypothetical protein